MGSKPKFKVELKSTSKLKINEQVSLVMDDISQPDSFVVLLGQPGTGKTTIPTYTAMQLMGKQTIRRIIVTRPSIEAGGRSLGFLPGELEDKFMPYMLAFQDILGWLGNSAENTFRHMVMTGQLVALPIQFCRGLTFDSNDLLIIDEAQNCTEEELALMITRMAEGSRLVIVGDENQSDLKRNEKSGLKKLLAKSDQLDFIKVHTLEQNFRSPRIQKFLEVWNGQESTD